MINKISKPDKILKGTVSLTASKSESNRVLIIQALCGDCFEIKHLAEAQDSQILKSIIEEDKKGITGEKTYDVKAGGTTMRFLTAYFSTQPGTRILTGTERMKQRPIGILVDALKKLGGDITYLENEGFPPLKITGKKLQGGEVELDGSVSSQFISALLLIAPELHHGLSIKLKSEVASRPYINMTLKVMEQFGVYGQWNEDVISVSKQNYSYKKETPYLIEADWSAASYYYAMAALAKEADLTILGLKKGSLQGDAIISELFPFFGVLTEFIEGGIKLKKYPVGTKEFGFDFSDCPDIVQTVAVVMAALKIPGVLNGLNTLKVKETDRVKALSEELQKLNVTVKQANRSSMEIIPGEIKNHSATIKTYEDHRMAMSFVPFALVFDEIKIENPKVVKKSYPAFWEDIKKLGFNVSAE